MGYLTLSTRIAILSLSLVALSGCGDSRRATLWPPGDSDVVLCPGDPRCGREDSPEIRAATCRINQTRLKFKCGEQDLPCPGAGCPTGEPGLPDQECWISETFIDMRCPSTPGPGPVADEAAPAAATPAEPAPAAAPAPAPAPDG